MRLKPLKLSFLRYDNEYGYAYRIADLIQYMCNADFGKHTPVTGQVLEHGDD